MSFFVYKIKKQDYTNYELELTNSNLHSLF